MRLSLSVTNLLSRLRSSSPRGAPAHAPGSNGGHASPTPPPRKDERSQVHAFVGSAADLEEQRGEIKAILYEVAGRESLEVIDFHDVILDASPWQTSIHPLLADSDIVILLFGQRLGQGTADELREALRLHRSRRLQDLALYFVEGEVSKGLAPDREVAALRERLDAEGITYNVVRSGPGFRRDLRSHLESWLSDELAARLIGAQVLRRHGHLVSGDLQETMRAEDVVYTDDVLEIAQRGATQLEGSDALRRYLGMSGVQAWSAGGVFHFLVATRLYAALLDEDAAIPRELPFIYPIHQHLACLIRKAPPPQRAKITTVLATWLTSPQSYPEITRNFAAFVLGMTRSVTLEARLFEAVARRNELRDVRLYAAMALGMIRQRRWVGPLAKLLEDERDEVVKRSIVNAIVFTTRSLEARTHAPDVAA